MKIQELKAKIIDILREEPRIFDGVCAKDIRKLLLKHHEISASEKIIIQVMMEIVNEGISQGHDGYICGDGSTLAWSDEQGNADSKLRGLHKYWWFNM